MGHYYDYTYNYACVWVCAYVYESQLEQSWNLLYITIKEIKAVATFEVMSSCFLFLLEIQQFYKVHIFLL